MKKILVSMIFTILTLVGCGGASNSAEASDAKKEPKFIILEEFYMLEGDAYKTKLIQNKKNKKCYLRLDYKPNHSDSRGFLSPSPCEI